MSEIAKVTTPSSLGAPVDVTANPSSATKVVLTWARPTGGAPVQNYHVFRGSSAANLTEVAVVAQTSFSDTAVNPGTRYYYGVEASNAAQNFSPMSGIVQVTTPSLPSPPGNVIAAPVSTTLVTLTWSAAASGGLPVASYHVYRGSSPATLNQISVVLQSSFSDTNVTTGTTYYYGVMAADTAEDLSPISATARVTVPSAPLPPSNLVATQTSPTSISLNWSAAVSGGLPIDRYRVFRGITTSSLLPLVDVNQTSYTDSSASPNTKYYYAVESVDSGGDLSAMSAIVSASPLPPLPAPGNLKATAVSKYQINLLWLQPKSGLPLASYIIYRGSSSTTLTSYRVVASTNSAFADYSVTAGATYYYGVQAQDTGGNVSPMSNVAVATVPH